ncbi:hypothetical protein [Flavobacterium sp.]|jgi:hypothetical protein|uniref:hypothetical protein n=1 Tax=Flavobacterium sp. TaxID=239 RepID=UPI0037C1A6B0
MMSLALIWLKKKLFSQAGFFLALMVGFLLLFIIPNTDTILTKFGFETKTALKGQLEGTKKDLQTAVQANEDLQSVGRIKDTVAESAEKELTANFDKKSDNQEKVTQISSKRDQIVKPAIAKLKMSTELVDGKIILDKVESDKISDANISSLNDTFDALFPTTKETS